MIEHKYAVLVHIGNPSEGITMWVNSYEELSSEEVLDIAKSKLMFESRKLVKNGSYEFKKDTE